MSVTIPEVKIFDVNRNQFIDTIENPSGELEGKINLPANNTASPIVYVFEVYVDGLPSGKVCQVTVSNVGNDTAEESGRDGETPEFRVNEYVLQYKYPTKIPNVWTDLLTLGYVHVQNIAAETWVINHSLDVADVFVQVKDSAGKDIIPEIKHLNASTVEVSFAKPVSGRAIIRR